MKLTNLKNYKLIRIEDLVKADWNYKKDEPGLVQKLVQNLKRNGQVENILVRKLETGYYEVVNGNHRYDALKELGAEHAICYDLGEISIKEAQRLAIETNETKFAVDQVELAGLIKELTEDFNLEDLEATLPYNQKQIEQYLEMADHTWGDDYNDEPPKDENESGEEQPEKLQVQITEEVLNMWQAWVRLVQKNIRGADGGVGLEMALLQLKRIKEEDLFFYNPQESE